MTVKFNRSVTLPGHFDPPMRSDFVAGEVVDSNVIPQSYLVGLMKAKHCEARQDEPPEELPIA